MLEAALRYIGSGLRVLPLHHPRSDGSCSCINPACDANGKHPATAHGVTDASNDPGQIRAWWADDPDYNIGIATGDGLTVLDIDYRKGAEKSLLRFPTMPSTPAVITGGDGAHYYFAGDAPSRVGLEPGIDVRGVGSYVVAPPSLHASGKRYVWDPIATLESTPLAPVPDHILTHAARKPPQLKPGMPIRAGTRNDTLARFAGAMRRVGMSEPAIQAALVVENERCEPPLDRGEVVGIATSISRYESLPASRVDEKLGVLSLFPWIPVSLTALTDARFGGKAKGLSPAEHRAMEWVLATQTGDFMWGSFSQMYRARQMGLHASTFSAQIGALIRKGFVATKLDRHYKRPRRRTPLAYCGEPYRVIETLWASRDRPELRELFERSAHERLARFVTEVEAGMWFWESDGLCSNDVPVQDIAGRFMAAYGPPQNDEVLT